MAYLKLQTQLVYHCKPTVDIVMNWLKREYKAEIKAVCGGSDCFVFEVKSDQLPSYKYIDVTIDEIVPQVLLLNVSYAE